LAVTKNHQNRVFFFQIQKPETDGKPPKTDQETSDFIQDLMFRLEKLKLLKGFIYSLLNS
jgi:hypothetical protein